MRTETAWRPFGDLLAQPLRNGLTRPKRVRGSGVKMVNMGELFEHRRIGNVPMERVPLSDHEAESYLLQPKDLLFARQSLVYSGAGKCSIFLGAPEPVTFEGHLIRARLDPCLGDPSFYFHFFNSTLGRKVIGQIVEQVSAAGIRGSDLVELEVPYPAIDEQRAIGMLLTALDDKIELNHKMNHTLESIARAIFKSWFVDFDPVWTKAEGEQPYGMDAETAALFPDTFVDSELGPIPEGWNVHTIGNLLELAYGKGLKAADRRPGSVPVYGSNGQVGWHDERLVDGPGIIVGRKGNPGTVTWSQTDFFPIDTTFYVVPHGPVNSLTYLFNALGLQNLPSLSSDSAVPGLNRNIACMSHMLVPPSSIVQCFDDSVRPLQLKVWSNQEENHTLAELRDTLLPKLISGELRVPEASELVEEEL